MLEHYIRFGLSVTVLFPESSESDMMHLSAFSRTAALPRYEMLETYLPDDAKIRQEELRIANGEGKGINYNFPPIFQIPGKYNPCSLDQSEVASAIEYAPIVNPVCPSVNIRGRTLAFTRT